jgi:molecular chaperone DnaK
MTYLIVNVVEGSHLAIPESNKPIAFLRIDGNMLSRDIAKGSDLEITDINNRVKRC